ncbi:MAG: response regulator [Chloroflexia bacterium]|nr:response regulator [Chloroflexia bacterium]
MRKRILIVDDEESTAFFLGENLSDLGAEYEVDTSFSGEDAIYKIAVQPFDLVITDLRMPGISGLDLFRWIRRASPDTRLILMTAYGSAEVESQAKRLSVQRYITKPFRMETFLEAVQQALGGKSLSQPGMLVLSDAAFEAITGRLDELRAEIDASCIVLADIMGQVITHSGIDSDLDVHTLVSLIGGGFATTFELARYMGQEGAFNLNYQEGEFYDIYTSNVGDNLLLVVLYGKPAQSSRIGLVWLYTRRAVGDLLRLMAEADMTEAHDLLSQDFESLLQHEMEQVFGGGDDDLLALTAALEDVAEPAVQPKPPQKPAPAQTPPAPQSEPAPVAPGKPAAAPALVQRKPALAPEARRPAVQQRPAPAEAASSKPAPAARPSPTAQPKRPRPEPKAAPATALAGGLQGDRATYSLEEALRLGLIDAELFQKLMGRKDSEYAAESS